MSNTNAPCTASAPELLFVEPETHGHSERAAQLDRSPYCVSRAENPLHIFLMRDAFDFSVAVLSDLVGPLTLRTSAQIIRQQWPKARILILGKVPSRFEDHLYDEAAVHASTESALLSALDRLSDNPSNQSSDAFTTWLGSVSHVPPPLPGGWTLQESDPRKLPASLLEADSSRDSPGSLQRLRRSR